MDKLYDGFSLLEDELKELISKVENTTDVLEYGAKDFVRDLLKLPKPISKIRKSGYTHLINTFSYRKNKKEIEVCWGKYYGPMVENGTVRMRASPHLNPLWNRNKNIYYEKIIKKIKLD